MKTFNTPTPRAPANTSDAEYFSEMYKRQFACDKYSNYAVPFHDAPMRSTEANTERQNSQGMDKDIYVENYFETELEARASRKGLAQGGFGKDTFRNFDYAINTHLEDMEKYEKKKKKEKEKQTNEDSRFLKSIGINPKHGIHMDRKTRPAVSLEHKRKNEIPEWARVFKQ